MCADRTGKFPALVLPRISQVVAVTAAVNSCRWVDRAHAGSRSVISAADKSTWQSTRKCSRIRMAGPIAGGRRALLRLHYAHGCGN